jgi:hypothetical protein
MFGFGLELLELFVCFESSVMAEIKHIVVTK